MTLTESHTTGETSQPKMAVSQMQKTHLPGHYDFLLGRNDVY